VEHIRLQAAYPNVNIPRPPNSIGDCLRFCQDVYQYLVGSRDVVSQNTLLYRTTRGTARSANPGGEGGSEGTPIQFKGQYDPTASYADQDIVITGVTTYASGTYQEEEDDAGLAGDFIANGSIGPGDAHPGVDTPTGAAATAILAGDAVSGATITNPGKGYASAPAITITGDGTGATGHAEIHGGTITGIVIDSGGSGYSHASIGIGGPGLQHWQDFARFHSRRFTLAQGNQRISFDVGRDDTNQLYVRIVKDITDTTGTTAVIDLDVGALLAIAGAGNYHIRPMEWEVCVGGVAMHAIFLSTSAY
jgi:hypothetical protein